MSWPVVRALGLAWACGLAAGGVAVPTVGAAPYVERVQEAVLGNGMKLILLEDHKAPVGVVQIWYRVGSRNEALGATGLSHLLEHMMFKGTHTVGPEEYNRIIQRNGGQTNAFTTQDYTTYFATMASDRLGAMIELEGDRMVNLVLDPALFAPERDVVKEERRLRTDNNPAAELFEQLSATAYAAHPYQFPVIGWMTELDALTVDDLTRHYRTYYTPNNAFAVAAGDFDAAALRGEFERTFGGLAAGAPPPPVRAIEPPQKGERRVELQREAELPYVAMAYHVPNFASDDAAALEVLSQILAGGDSTRLYHEIVYRQRLARDVGASYDLVSPDPGLFAVYGQPLPGKTATALERALEAQLERLKGAPPSLAELAKAKKGIEAAFVFAQDSLFYQAMLLGQYEITGDWRRIDQYLPAIRAVTGEDVMRVARTYLGRGNRTVATLAALPPTSGRAPAAGAPRGPLH